MGSKDEIVFTVFKGSKSGDIVQSRTTHKPLTGDQVLVSITASGLCGTDLHYRQVDMVLGHEGIGTVTATGPGVTKLKKGDRVGWGYEHNSCGRCQQCRQGTETYCPERAMYGYADLDQGSFAYGAVWREAFLFEIPNELTDEEAAPLMCGGATVFNALHVYGARPTDRVGIVGVGGLGHLAIQFAAKMGCETVVFSGTDSKKSEALSLGATEFHTTKDVKKLVLSSGLIDILLVTTSASPDWSLYIPILSPGAKIFPLNVDEGDFKFPHMALLGGGITVQGSLVAPRHVHARMLTFAAQHGIKPMVNIFKMDREGIEKAMSRLDEGKMRYRGVLVAPKESKL